MIPDNAAFVLKGGKKIRTLRELGRVLQEIDKETFRHHVNGEKNDFADWITNIARNPHLANSIRSLENPQTMASTISIILTKKEIEEEKN